MATPNANTNVDLQDCLVKIRSYFPDINVTKENLQKPTAEFTTTFYHAYLNEIKFECQKLFPCIDIDDITSLCPPTMDHERYVFIFIKYVLNKIAITFFTLMDFHQPAKRTQITIKFLIYFLTYVKDNCLEIKKSVDKFNKEIEERKATGMRILSKKEEISKISQEIGLSMEKLEQLEKEYNSEFGLQSGLSKGESELDKEIETLRKEEQALISSMNSQLLELENVNKEIKVLSNELVIEEEYEACAMNLKEIENKIEEYDKLTTDYEQILKDNHNQIDHYKDCMTIIPQIDLSWIEKTKKIEKLKQEIANNEEEHLNSQKQIKNSQKELERKKQNLISNDEAFQVEKGKLENMSKQAEADINRLTEELKSEMVLHEKLCKEFNKDKVDLENSEKECDKLTDQQKKLEDFHQDFYKKMVEQQDILVNHFNSNVEEILEKSMKK